MALDGIEACIFYWVLIPKLLECSLYCDVATWAVVTELWVWMLVDLGILCVLVSAHCFSFLTKLALPWVLQGMTGVCFWLGLVLFLSICNQLHPNCPDNTWQLRQTSVSSLVSQPCISLSHLTLFAKDLALKKPDGLVIWILDTRTHTSMSRIPHWRKKDN